MTSPRSTGPRGTGAGWRGSGRTLLQGGLIYSPAHPFSTAMLIDGDTIAWIGEDTAADVHRDTADVVIDLDGAFVAPGFVDAHVHSTSTGLLLNGLDLTGVTSASDLLRRLSDATAGHTGDVLLGHGWDETTWSDPALPTRTEIDASVGATPVYLSRIDVHSALASSALVDAAPQCRDLDGWSADGPLSRDSHLRVRDAALASISADQRRAAHQAMRDHAAAHGIVAFHEMAGPSISSASDLDMLLALAEDEPGPLVIGYWGELAQQGGIETARTLGAVGVAGDLFIDGAIGSRTACLHEPYRDQPSTAGAAYLTTDDVAEHLARATEAGMQGGFHVIGDAASATIMTGLAGAVERCGAGAVRSAGHRLEHAEMLSDSDITMMAEYGIAASMQPVFDLLWGGPGGMYERRLGAARMSTMNRFADIAGAGVLLAFGSDAPVTSVGPWQAIAAAIHHTNPLQRISARAAFTAHSRGAWRAAGMNGVGVLTPGAPAHLAVWRAEEFEVNAPDDRVAGWSTDPRSGTPALPVLDGASWPTCLATMVSGTLVHRAPEFPWP